MGIRPTLQAHIASACPLLRPIQALCSLYPIVCEDTPADYENNGVVIEPLGYVSVCVVSLLISL
jgi:hypothetical protein